MACPMAGSGALRPMAHGLLSSDLTPGGQHGLSDVAKAAAHQTSKGSKGSMGNKHLAREARAQGPAGLPTASAIAGAGFFGLRTSRSTKTKHVVGVKFLPPAEGCFWEPFVSHNDHLAKAREERQAEANALRRLERAERKRLWAMGEREAMSQGLTKEDPMWAIAVHAAALVKLRETMAQWPVYHRPMRSCALEECSDFHAVESPRRASPVESRTEVTRGTSGIQRRVMHAEVFTLRQAFPAEQSNPEPDVSRHRPYSGDGITPPFRSSVTETFTETDGGVLTHRQRKPFQRRTTELEGAKEKPRVLTGIRVDAVPHMHRRAAAAPDQRFGATHNADGRLPKMG